MNFCSTVSGLTVAGWLLSLGGASPSPRLLSPDELAQDLGIELRELHPFPKEIPADLLHRVAERLGQPGDFLEGVRLFEAKGKPTAQPAESDLTVGVLPLKSALSGARLVFAVLPDGRLGMASVLGRPEFDGDKELSWSLFLGQLSAFGALGSKEEFLQEPGDGKPVAELERYLAELEKRKDPDAVLQRALLRQRALMRGFTLLQRRLVLQPTPPPREWLVKKRTEMEEVAKLSPAFDAILGDKEARHHAELAKEAARYFGELEAAAKKGNEEFARVAGRARNCATCHRLSAEGQGRWTDAFEAVRDGFETPRGTLRVGFDVAPALGDDQGTSQRIADAVHAVLMLVRELRG